MPRPCLTDTRRRAVFTSLNTENVRTNTKDTQLTVYVHWQKGKVIPLRLAPVGSLRTRNGHVIADHSANCSKSLNSLNTFPPP